MKGEKRMEMDIRGKVGQRLVFGFRDDEPSESFRELIREYKIGNIILFRGNIKSAAQVKRLCADLQAMVQDVTGQPAFIAIDQEGGRISRLPYDAVNVPSQMAIAATGDEQNAYLSAAITARQLKGLGVNLPLAPVLDVNSNRDNPVIGVRSFGDDAEAVARLGVKTVRAFRDNGVLCCAKHFPGHGDTAVDSHIGLPIIDKGLDELRRTELLPFQAAIDAGVPAVMSSHILFPRLEPDNVPATMSRRVMHDLLRGVMGFRGLILSDCMIMDAIQKHYGTPEGVVAAMQAGVDMVFVCSNPALQRRSAQAALRVAQDGLLDGLDACAERIVRAKERYAFAGATEGLASQPEDFSAADALARSAVTLVDGTPPMADDSTFFCGCADYRTTPAAEFDPDAVPFPVFMNRAFGGPYAVASTDPGREEIEQITQMTTPGQPAVVSLCNAHMYPGQAALARVLIQKGAAVTLVALRDPYDLAMVSGCRAKIAAFDYSPSALRALCGVLRGGALTGRLPVRI